MTSRYESMIPIIYPERRMVHTETLRNLFSDAIANGVIDAEEGDGTLYRMCLALESAGFITLRDDWKDFVDDDRRANE